MVRPDGSAVLMDFGLAGWDKIEILAGRGSIGTPMYQPPEQADVNGPLGKIS
ncbi:MAG TPA: serine/threonine protein kinase, partial [Planctomycetes bacterium]|nr:serine/threonine protein kinase [Planctomycetota bacterium]